MATELLPVVDLRVLSQPDLDALAAASAHAVAPRSCPDADQLPPLKIDRAVFNESAGSRKQTFSRLRLAAAANSSPSALTTSPSSTTPSAGSDPEHRLVAYHLRRLFARDDLPCPPSPPPLPETLALPGPSHSPPRPPSPNPDRETTNSKGVSVDLVRLAGLVEPYDGELRRRTAGMMSESELMGFISGLGGQWVSQRQRRKWVDAAFFGDHLPSGWKLQLGLKRKEGDVWVHCFRYMSPRGHQFATCKEVSAYLMSLLGYPEAITVPIQYISTEQEDLCDGDGDDDAVGFQHQISSSVDNQNVLPVTSVSFSGLSDNSKDKVDGNINPPNTYVCPKCNLTLHDQSAYAQHQLLFHEKSAKRRRKITKFGEPVVGKDGKFECPVCSKTFEEQSRYFGHVGSHARYQGLTPEAFLDKISSGKVVSDSLTDLSFSLQELTESPEKNGITVDETGYHHRSISNKHGGDSSKVIELFSTNYSDNFNRPNETWRRPEEFPPVTDAPSACKYMDNTMRCADVTAPEIAPQSNDQLDGRVNGYAEVAGFNDQAGSCHVFRQTTFESPNRYEDQIIGHGLATSKQGGVNNTVKPRDVNLNSRLNTISFPIASANNETTTALNEVNQSSITGKCFSGSFNNNDGASTTSSCSGSSNKISGSLGVSIGSSNAARCISASYSNDNVACKANIFGNKNNSMVYQSSLSPASPVATNLDHSAPCSTHSSNSDKMCSYNTKEQMDIMQNRTSNEAGFGVEVYKNDVYTDDATLRSVPRFNNNISHLNPNSSIHCPVPQSNALAVSNLTKGIDANSMKGSLVYRSDANSMNGSFVNRPISNNESHGSVNDVMGKHSNDMQNYYSDSAHNCIRVAPTNTSQNVNGLMSVQASFGTMSSVVRSVVDIPMSHTTQDQCDLQLGFGGQKQHIYPGFGELRSPASGSHQLGSMARNNSLPTGSSQFGSMARPNSLPPGSSQFRSLANPNHVQTGFSQFGSMSRSNSVQTAPSQYGDMARPNPVPPAGSSQFVSMPRQNFASRSEPTLVLGYEPQMGRGPPVQSGWDLNLSRMVAAGGMITAVCVWCNSQFHHFGPIDGQQVGTYGLICPACKDRMSGQRNMPNNGSWQT